MWQTLKSWLAPSPEREAAHRLYTTLVGAARNPFFYASCGVPDTGEGRFEMIALHVALADARLQREGEAAAALRRALMETMVSDLDRSLREMGVGDLSVGKKVKRLAGSSWLRLRAYAPQAGDAKACAAQLALYLRQHAPEAPLDEAEIARAIARLSDTLGGLTREALEAGDWA